MNNLDLVILISIIILILILILNKVKKIKNIIHPIQKKNNNIQNKKINLKQILNTHNNFYKNFITTNIDDNELEKLNINKGNLSRHTIIGEQGGSKNYNNFTVSSNISNNLINYDNTNSTYKKLPYKVK